MTEWSPTARQQRDLDLAVRHIGRALAALGRVGIPTTSGDGRQPGLYALIAAERSLAEASDSLIDGLELVRPVFDLEEDHRE
ncbi:hypothetical protein [Agromyces humi]|uniref:hypothetical protein n=1 Tax=Agromyces humi TaxID=1766800 RepID=UPI00135C8E82|nr:hypothetical protein [Agromyces humi]